MITFRDVYLCESCMGGFDSAPKKSTFDLGYIPKCLFPLSVIFVKLHFLLIFWDISLTYRKNSTQRVILTAKTVKMNKTNYILDPNFSAPQ